MPQFLSWKNQALQPILQQATRGSSEIFGCGLCEKNLDPESIFILMPRFAGLIVKKKIEEEMYHTGYCFGRKLSDKLWNKSEHPSCSFCEKIHLVQLPTHTWREVKTEKSLHPCVFDSVLVRHHVDTALCYRHVTSLSPAPCHPQHPLF